MRLIDADALFAEIENDYKNANGMRRRGLSDALDSIADAPTIDAVPVVRCKDCRHRVERGMCYMISGCHQLVGVGDNFWCAYGERKDGDGNG